MLVRDGVIVAVGTGIPAGDADGVQVHDLGGMILAPGLVDAHCHLEWGLIGGLVPDAPFGEWLGNLVRRTMGVTPEDRDRAARWSAMTAVRSGTTTVADSGPSGFGVPATRAAGLRGIIHLEIFGRDEGREAREKVKRHAEAVLAATDGAGARIAVGTSPHSPYTVGPDLWSRLLEDEILRGGSLAAHVAESPDEVQLLDDGTGRLVDAIRSVGRVPARWPGGGPGVVSRLVAAGAMSEGLIAAHCVQVGAEDARMLAELDVRVAHCPQSNVRLSCGDAPVELLEAVGVTVGLGTDSPASAGAFDLRAEARAAGAAAARRGARPAAADLLRMATLGSARVIGMDEEIGAITPGRRADIVAIRPVPGADVESDPAAAVLDARATVAWSFVDGEVVLADGMPTRLDPERIIADARASRSATEAAPG